MNKFIKISEAIKNKARELGFDKVGIASAIKLTREAGNLDEWLSRRYNASMTWMERNREKRKNPSEIVPGARSVVSVGINYFTGHEMSEDPERGKISRYAWGYDYHDILGERLKLLWEFIKETAPDAEGKFYVDTGPVMEKVWAQHSGLGWIGKHTNLISRDFGSWLFLGEIITNLKLKYDEPMADHCGSCRKCIDACPTNALVEEYILDSGKCLSYITIENRGDYPAAIKPNANNWIFGCDICQDVCPWNVKFARPASISGFEPRPGNINPPLSEIISMTRDEFKMRFSNSPVKRTNHAGLLRNARAVSE